MRAASTLLVLPGVVGGGGEPDAFTQNLCPNFYLEPWSPGAQCAADGPECAPAPSQRCALHPAQRLTGVMVFCRGASTTLFDYVHNELAPALGDDGIAVARAEANLRREMVRSGGGGGGVRGVWGGLDARKVTAVKARCGARKQIASSQPSAPNRPHTPRRAPTRSWRRRERSGGPVFRNLAALPPYRPTALPPTPPAEPVASPS